MCVYERERERERAKEEENSTTCISPGASLAVQWLRLRAPNAGDVV